MAPKTALTLIAVAVRAGFVVAFTERVKQGDKIVSREQMYYPEDGTIELSPERVLEHAHKLEPVGEEAASFLEQLHVKFDAPAAGAPAPDAAAIAAAAVTATLAALGIDADTLAAAMAAKAPAKVSKAPAAPAGSPPSAS